MFKLVDESDDDDDDVIDSIDMEEGLFYRLRKHLDGLFEDKSDDEKLFWATYSYYDIDVDEDEVRFCSKLSSVGYPIYDVSVEKSEQTSIVVIPYKISGIKEYTISELSLDEPGKTGISPLDILGWKEDLQQKWKGKIWMRTGFTGWNTINCSFIKIQPFY